MQRDRQNTDTNKAKPTTAQVKDTLRLRKDLRASKAERDESDRNARANMDLERQRATEQRYGTRSRAKIPKKQSGQGMTDQEGSGPAIDMGDMPDNMSNEQIADMLVDQGIARMQSNPIEARRDFEHALSLDPKYTLAQEYY